MEFLDKKRKQIDKIDKKIIKLLELRFKLIRELILWKRKNNIALEDLKRENEINR